MGWPVGKHLSEEHKKKISIATKGENNPMFGVCRSGADNPMYGKKHSAESISRIQQAMKGKYSGSKNPMYGVHRYGKDAPGYGKIKENIHIVSLHQWVRTRLFKPTVCQICSLKQPYDVANISKKYDPLTYNRNLVNWRWLCRSCHIKDDGRINNLSYRNRDPKTGRYV